MTNNYQPKVITIVDSFVRNDGIRQKLMDMLKWLNMDGHEVLLVTNTPVDKEVMCNVKFCIYDQRNQLFEKKYENTPQSYFWKILGNMDTRSYDIVDGIQKHGLSVLINLFNSLKFARAQGYTHFQRLEVDDIYGPQSIQFIKKIPELVKSGDKNGLFYYNHYNIPNDVSFHYYYCEIDTFLKKIRNISSEDDYIAYLNEFYNKSEFRNVEIFLHDHLLKYGDSDILQRTSQQMAEDFSDTKWNTETSISNYDKKYVNECVTKIYFTQLLNKSTNESVRGKDYVVFTYLYGTNPVNRKIVVENKNGTTFDIRHDMLYTGNWTWDILPSDTKYIHVYEGGTHLYTEDAETTVSYFEFKQ